MIFTVYDELIDAYRNCFTPEQGKLTSKIFFLLEAWRGGAEQAGYLAVWRPERWPNILSNLYSEGREYYSQ